MLSFAFRAISQGKFLSLGEEKLLMGCDKAFAAWEYLKPTNNSRRAAVHMICSAQTGSFFPFIFAHLRRSLLIGAAHCTGCRAERRLGHRTRHNEMHTFVGVPKRWIVERTIAWLDRGRRLAKPQSQDAAFLRLALVGLMMRTHEFPHDVSGQPLTADPLYS